MMPVEIIEMRNQGDSMFKSPDSVVADLQTLRDREAYHSLYQGLRSRLVSSFRQNDQLVANQVFDDVANEKKIPDPDFPELKSLSWINEDVVLAGGSDAQIAYSKHLGLLVSARRNSLIPLHIYARRYQGITRSMPSEEDIKTTTRVIVEVVVPYNLAAERLSRLVIQEEQVLFGGNELASHLWKAAVYLRTSSLPESVTGRSLRVPMLKMLIDGEYVEAKQYLEELLTKYPKLMPDFAEKALGIEPDILKAIKLEVEEEQSETRKMEQAAIQGELLAFLESCKDAEFVAPDGRTMRLVRRKNEKHEIHRIVMGVSITEGSVSFGIAASLEEIWNRIVSEGWDLKEEYRLFHLDGNVLRDLRGKYNLSQTELGILMGGLRQGKISIFERGMDNRGSRPWKENAARILEYSRALGIDPHTLLLELQDSDAFDQIVAKIKETENAHEMLEI